MPYTHFKAIGHIVSINCTQKKKEKNIFSTSKNVLFSTKKQVLIHQKKIVISRQKLPF